MARRSALPACLLLLMLLRLWTLPAFLSAADVGIEVKKLGGNKVELVCSGAPDATWTKDGDDINSTILEYEDGNSGVYQCSATSSDSRTIYVKFRTCDNCIDLDTYSLVGLAVGDLVATAVIGVAVYLVASQARIGSNTSPQKKSSDRQHLVPNEMGSRGSNDHYERLRHKGQRETYDVINKR